MSDSLCGLIAGGLDCWRPSAVGTKGCEIGCHGFTDFGKAVLFGKVIEP